MNKKFVPEVSRAGQVHCLRVFVNGAGGGNPVPLVADASGMTAGQMQDVARESGHESAFVLPAEGSAADWRLRFFVPNHEMEMCGHATVGTLWALRQWGLWTSRTAVVETMSGLVHAEWDEAGSQVWISQPGVRRQQLSAEDSLRVAAVLGLPATGTGVVATNAATSRVKTLVPVASVHVLDHLSPDFSSMESVCSAIDSTGLYPYVLENDVVHARQFPKAAGYPEDAATGIAAAALWGHLTLAGIIATGTPDAPVTCTIRQGDAMGCPSAIQVRPRFDDAAQVIGCWVSGQVEWSAS